MEGGNSERGRAHSATGGDSRACIGNPRLKGEHHFLSRRDERKGDTEAEKGCLP